MSEAPHPSLLKQQEAFKRTLKAQPIVSRPMTLESRSIPSETAVKPPPLNSSLERLSTMQPSNVSRHLNSLLHSIISELKAAETPLTYKEIQQRTSIDLNQPHYTELCDVLSHNDRIYHDTIQGTIEYKYPHRVKSKEDLKSIIFSIKKPLDLSSINEDSSSKYSGILFADLQRDAYSKHLDEYTQDLKNNNEIIIIHNKDESQKVLFPNWHSEITASMDKEFVDLWHQIPLPHDDDIEKELEKVGLKTMDVFETIAKVQPKTKKRKRATNRPLKLTNVHLKNIDLTKDYQTPSL